jgi:SAM-dependent methyltransferase
VSLLDSRYYKDLWLQKSGQREYKFKPDTSVYSKVRDLFFNVHENGRHSVAKELLKGATGTLLDIGCWGGEALLSMGALEQFSDVHGVDLLEESVNRANALGVKASVCNLNEEPLPFANNRFDIVTCLAVVGQVFDPDFVFREVHRVLKSGGILILNVPNVASLPNRVRLFFGKAPVTSRDPGWDGGQLHYFTMGDVVDALSGHGFDVERVCASGGGLWLRRMRPSLLSGTLTFKAIKR